MKPDFVIREFARRVREELGENLREIILFGSRARGDHKDGSDYDFLLILEKKESYAEEIILQICVEFLDKYGALVVPIIRTEEAWTRESRLPLGIMVNREGISL